MAEKMKAIAKVEAAPGLELIEVNVPQIKNDEILIKVETTSICGTDLHIYNWDKWSQNRIKVPRVIGHELAGVVVDTGPQVRNIKVGDFVSAESHIVCSNCYLCRTGQYHICRDFKIIGVDVDGVFADYVALPEICAWKNEDDFDRDLASIQEPFGNAVQTAYVDELVGKSVAIFGLGAIGLFCIPLVEVAGATQIFAVDVNEYKLNLARKLSKKANILHGINDDVVSIMLDATDGLGIDVVLEVSGNNAALINELKVLRNGGRLSMLGIPSQPVELNLAEQIVLKGVSVYGITGRKMFDTWYKTSSLIKSGQVDVKPVITHKFQMEDYKQAFELMKSGESGKIVLYP
ncbi:MAG: L-threonine 3-dehydrogenase [Cyanobacteriota bacterium]